MAEESGFDSWQENEIILFLTLQIGSRAYPASYAVDTGGSFPRGKVTGA
jgi:hypothetical protein